MTDTDKPTIPGIYPVKLNTGRRTFAKWDGAHWYLWCEAWDPPEWDRVEQLNCRVIDWGTAEKTDHVN